VAGSTDVGLVRGNNEDSFLIADLTNGGTAQRRSLEYESGQRGSLFAVADGMGGAAGGEVASRMAVESIASSLRAAGYTNWTTFIAALKNAVEQANTLIHDKSRRTENLRGMGTTITAAGIYGCSIAFAQIGDSRAYLIRNKTITQMTKDQSLVEELIGAGLLTPEQAKNHPQRNVITQALGSQEQLNVVLSTVELREGDWLILCTDGLSGKLEDVELGEIVEHCSSAEDACEKMVALARDRGGEDNITVIAAAFSGESLPPARPEDTAHYQPVAADP
jgi:protein phosphatase